MLFSAIITSMELTQAPISKELIKKYLPEDPIIIEAGAHIGRDTLKMSLLWPQGLIYAFEPVPELYTQLLARTKDQSNVHCYNTALSDKSGTATLYVSSGASTAASSLLEPFEYKTDRPTVFFHPIEVATITLDEWAEREGVKKVDFLWLDMQGHELTVLNASPQLLSTTQALLIEASLTERFKGNPLRDEVQHWMEIHGFKAIQHDIPKHNKVNILFIKT